jgi:hypothetical protein
LTENFATKQANRPDEVFSARSFPGIPPEIACSTVQLAGVSGLEEGQKEGGVAMAEVVHMDSLGVGDFEKLTVLLGVAPGIDSNIEPLNWNQTNYATLHPEVFLVPERGEDASADRELLFKRQGSDPVTGLRFSSSLLEGVEASLKYLCSEGVTLGIENLPPEFYVDPRDDHEAGRYSFLLPPACWDPIVLSDILDDIEADRVRLTVDVAHLAASLIQERDYFLSNYNIADPREDMTASIIDIFDRVRGRVGAVHFSGLNLGYERCAPGVRDGDPGITLFSRRWNDWVGLKIRKYFYDHAYSSASDNHVNLPVLLDYLRRDDGIDYIVFEVAPTMLLDMGLDIGLRSLRNFLRERGRRLKRSILHQRQEV